MIANQVWEEASKLAANPKVARRIASLRQAVETAVTEQRAWDRVRLLDVAEEKLPQAIRDSKLAAANGTLRLIAKAAGLLEGQPQAPMQASKVTAVLSSREDSEHSS
jgi:hypothetical protein